MDESVGSEGVSCAKCGTQVARDEKFCTSCGASMGVADVAASPAPVDHHPMPSLARLANEQHMSSARKWLVGLAVLTLLSGLVFYALGKSKVEDEIRAAEQATAHVDRAELDRHMQQETGMTFQQAIDHDRGLVTLLLVVNIVLAGIYFGLSFYAKKNALTASVIALLLFITVIVISAVYDPKTIVQGVLVKILFIGALIKAITAASEERRLARSHAAP